MATKNDVLKNVYKLRAQEGGRKKSKIGRYLDVEHHRMTEEDKAYKKRMKKVAEYNKEVKKKKDMGEFTSVFKDYRAEKKKALAKDAKKFNKKAVKKLKKKGKKK
jgi:hypothetical protein